jgi:magnesium chelatase family protein
LPPLTVAEAIEVSRVRSSAGLTSGAGLDLTPPFRQPHHSGSEAGIIGGGAVPRPGEASLAHNGVLFLDELPEFSRSVLESLRQPLEEGVVVLSRAAGAVALPASFQLVAARNPCPCGRLSDDSGAGCECSPEQVKRYERRVSAPLLDRVDLRMNLPRLTEDELLRAPDGEPSSVVRARVTAARAVMVDRQGCVNASLRGGLLRSVATPEAVAEPLLRALVQRLDLSGRGFDRLLRVARTIADLAGSPAVGASHLAEAAAYRAV